MRKQFVEFRQEKKSCAFCPLIFSEGGRHDCFLARQPCCKYVPEMGQFQVSKSRLKQPFHQLVSIHGATRNHFSSNLPEKTQKKTLGTQISISRNKKWNRFHSCLFFFIPSLPEKVLPNACTGDHTNTNDCEYTLVWL